MDTPNFSGASDIVIDKTVEGLKVKKLEIQCYFYILKDENYCLKTFANRSKITKITIFVVIEYGGIISTLIQK